MSKMTFRIYRLGLLLLVAGGLAGYLFLRTKPAKQIAPIDGSETNQHSQTVSPPKWEQFVTTQFAGDLSCAECHQREHDAHLRSGHSKTAMRMEESHAATILNQKQFQAPGESRSVNFSLTSEGLITTIKSGERSIERKVGWLLGSGIHAQTPVTINTTNNTGIESFWTLIGKDQRLEKTPGQPDYHGEELGEYNLEGRTMSTEEVIKCFGCHMTFGPAPGSPPEKVSLSNVKWHPNISCERCHGPRRSHVQAAYAGKGELVKPLVKLSQPKVEMELCSQCHRDTKRVNKNQPDSDLIRFQPYRMELSSCYQQSIEVMACSTCHDPHDKTSGNMALYQSKCIQCHSSETESTCHRDQKKDQPGDHCISCHMPKREWSSGIHFTDHWIRVVKEQEENKGNSTQ